MINFSTHDEHRSDKYDGKNIRWIDRGDHYELIFADDFITPSTTGLHQQNNVLLSPFCGNALLTDIIMDMRNGEKHREVHVFVGSFGGEVAALNMILQQLLTYEYRVGINLGTACSCGWMLLFACQERYVSPFSQNMYHDISCVCGGKHSELHHNAEFMGKLQKELLKVTDTTRVLTEKELELGRTTEVCITGRELIERGAAKDYNEYLRRTIPVPNEGFLHVGNKNYTKTPFGWIEFKITGEKPVTYEEVLAQINAPERDMQELLKELEKEEKKAKEAQKKARSKKKKKEQAKVSEVLASENKSAAEKQLEKRSA